MKLERSRDSSPTGFRALALTTCAATYSLVVLGGVVRATESGDACPDWPRCQGELLPPLETAVMIEFSHRLLASLVGLLVVALAVAAWRSHPRVPVIVWGATAAVGLVAGQIVLGGMTVLNDLPSSMVMAHLALALTLLATLLAVAYGTFPVAPAETLPANRTDAISFRNLTLIVALASLALILTGSYVSGSGASLAFRDWPLFDGQLLPDGGRLAVIHATHRLAAAAFGFLLIYLVLQAWQTQRGTPLVIGSMLALALYAILVPVGAANIWTLLQPAATAAHLALAAALWATLVGVALLASWATLPVDAPTLERRPGHARPASGTLPAGRAF